MEFGGLTRDMISGGEISSFSCEILIKSHVWVGLTWFDPKNGFSLNFVVGKYVFVCPGQLWLVNTILADTDRLSQAIWFCRGSNLACRKRDWIGFLEIWALKKNRNFVDNSICFSEMFGHCPQLSRELSDAQETCFTPRIVSGPSRQAVRAVNHGWRFAAPTGVNQFYQVLIKKSQFKLNIVCRVSRLLCEDLVPGSMNSVVFVCEKFELPQGRPVVAQNL